MQYIEAPNELIFVRTPSIFLAGGITNCRNWQAEAIIHLSHTPFTVLNPRRENFPIHDPSASRAQIAWEFHAFDMVDHVIFWFCRETLCPIVLFELGKQLYRYDLHQRVAGSLKLFIGMDNDYQRRQDVEIQTSLVDPDLPIFYDLGKLCDAASASIETA